ncbi:hypothetical protein [Paraferrimonas sp. SM1919]|uniref:hypothetical protein n=1 Tax=Paraferrimonas sp. SM1919 TaxID=2662263 RepID=UPI0013D048D5|nr:hypothetical protein [Paraferrimonas sp. SM1919]
MKPLILPLILLTSLLSGCTSHYQPGTFSGLNNWLLQEQTGQWQQQANQAQLKLGQNIQQLNLHCDDQGRLTLDLIVQSQNTMNAYASIHLINHFGQAHFINVENVDELANNRLQISAKVNQLTKDFLAEHPLSMISAIAGELALAINIQNQSHLQKFLNQCKAPVAQTAALVKPSSKFTPVATSNFFVKSVDLSELALHQDIAKLNGSIIKIHSNKLNYQVTQVLQNNIALLQPPLSNTDDIILPNIVIRGANQYKVGDNQLESARYYRVEGLRHYGTVAGSEQQALMLTDVTDKVIKK